MRVMTVYRESFMDVPLRLSLSHGMTLAEMVGRMPVANDFAQRGTISVNGAVIPAGAWHLCRPKPETVVTMHMPAAGGGDDGGGKQIFALVASLALTIAGGWIVAGGLATAGGWFAAGSISASVLAGTVSLVGSLLLSALAPPPVEKRKGNDIKAPGSAGAEGNVLEPNGAVIRIIGERRVFPQLAAEPFVYFDGPDEVVEAAYILAGPHRLEDIQIGAAGIVETGIEYEVREGWTGDLPLTLTERQTFTEASQDELRAHLVSDSDNRTLDDTVGNIIDALPQAYTVATREAPDEQLLHFSFPQGLNEKASETVKMRVPIRIRIRARGDVAWINLPEMHFHASSVQLIRATVRLLFTDTPAASPSAVTGEGWCEARRFSPGQTNAPAQADWSADAYFGAAGDVYMTASNLGTSGVDNITLDRYTATIHLDTATFPKGRYEIEVLRGASFKSSAYVSSTYEVSGTVWDLFGYQGTPAQIVAARDGVIDNLYLLRSVSVWNEHPVPTSDFACIAVKARNRRIERLSVLAGGYVRDWDGSAWRDWVVTSNPAPHLRDIYVGRLNVDPVEETAVDDAALLEWRTHCTTMGYDCNAIIQGSTVMEAAGIVAACGYARPRMSDKWGVVRDYDRSAESPIQVFTPNNLNNYSWTKAFARVPDGFRVTFDDAAAEYQTDQVLVLAPGNSWDTTKIEQVRYEGITDRTKAIARATYDQLQPEYRSCFYSFDASADSIVCEQGDLVGVVHETIDETVGFGRVVDTILNGAGLITAVRLENGAPIFGEAGFDTITDMGLVEDMGMIGAVAGLALRRTTGTILTAGVTTDAGDPTLLTFTTPQAAAGIEPGILATFGRLGQEYLRLIVFSIMPKEDFKATVTCLDEAPELWT